jgi:PAS domain S-box-containing protein
MSQNTSSEQVLTFKEFGLDGFASTLNKELISNNNLIDKLCEQYKILDIVSELTSDYFFQLSICDNAFKIDWIKGKFEEITGYPKEIITDLQKWISFIHPDDVHIVKNATVKVLSNSRSVTEYRFKSKTGEIKYLRDYTYPVWDEKQNKVTKIIGAVKDITETKLNEEALKISEQKLLNYSDELKALNASKDKLFSIIAHDLREPFSGIVGNLELLNDSISSFSKDEIQSMVQDSLECAKNAYMLLENLLEWSRIQGGNSHAEPTNLKLYDLAESAVKIFSTIISDKRISVINNIEKNLQVLADERMIHSVFRNLISNAVKFSSTGGKILISSILESDFVRICVEDDGIGISNENVKRLFCKDSYYSTPGTNSEKGNGLGLILCKEFVEKNNGKIWVESEIGNGSRFIFTLNHFDPHQ